jgi:hypothetical protein
MELGRMQRNENGIELSIRISMENTHYNPFKTKK